MELKILETDDDFNQFVMVKGVCKRTKCVFKCRVCGNIDTKSVAAMRNYPFKCKLCTLKESHKGDNYIQKLHKTKLEKYGDPLYINTAKIRAVLNEKYGGSPLNDPDIKEKYTKTMMAKYGCEHPSQINDYVEKCKSTRLKKYGDENFNNREKYRQTCLSVYGVEHASQNAEVIQKSKTTKTMLYGDPTFNNHEKTVRTNMERYGVPATMQVKEFSDKTHSKYTYNGMLFDSTNEIAYYIWLVDNGHLVEYQPAVEFDYQYDGSLHKYYPDFMVDGQLVEIKGLQFFENKDASSKMINPYDRRMDGLYEAKHQCMVAHNVKIVTDCKAAIKYVSRKYGPNFLSSCKNKRK